MKRIRLFLALVAVLAASLTLTSRAHADISCSDCISLCILSQCGFVQDPACVDASYPGCAADCTAQGYC
jgi:hypothetical protein